MPQHLQRDLDELSKQLLKLGGMVEEATNRAITAAAKRDKALAVAVIDGDSQINVLENQIEEDALKTLALHQPVARDLRFIITALKVNNDLERMGDLAANISERTIQLSENEPVPMPECFGQLATSVRGMVHDSLNALVDRNADLARRVCEVDDEVDKINREMIATMFRLMKASPDLIEPAVAIISISRHLERIGDLATNIAEDVIFMAEGEIVRHTF